MKQLYQAKVDAQAEAQADYFGNIVRLVQEEAKRNPVRLDEWDELAE